MPRASGSRRSSTSASGVGVSTATRTSAGVGDSNGRLWRGTSLRASPDRSEVAPRARVRQSGDCRSESDPAASRYLHALEAALLEHRAHVLGAVEGVDARGEVGGCRVAVLPEPEDELSTRPEYAVQLAQMADRVRPE